MKIAIYTLGCKVNQYETQAMEAELLTRGYELVPFETQADAYIINTCTVTAVSDKKSRQVIRRARKENPNAVIGVCGCYAQTAPEAVKELEVDLVSGTAGRMAFLDDLESALEDRRAAHLAGEGPRMTVDDAMRRRSFEVLPAGGLEGRTRAMLMEDGCVNFCTYCIIPYARGPIRSLSIPEAEEQCRRLGEEGYREVVLTGIEISSWGAERRDGSGLIDLIEAVCRALPEGTRVRLGSLEPRTITADFCRRAAALPNLCPHFHLSMQSGCDSVLKRMNRKYTAEEYKHKCDLLRKVYGNPALTTDVIVGFPQESEEEFEESRAFVEDIHFFETHIFKYSRREGTRAAAMAGQIPEQEKTKRSHVLLELDERRRQEYMEGFLGKELEVLMEEEVEIDGVHYWTGHTREYLRVAVLSEENLMNQMVLVTPARILGKDCLM